MAPGVEAPVEGSEPVAADALTRSSAILTAAGFVLVPLARPIAHAWDILAVAPTGLLLVAVGIGKAWPSTLGVVYGHPAGWPPSTRRLLHRWGPDSEWPQVRVVP
jgi:hypothetical protein